MPLMTMGKVAELFAEVESEFPASYFRRQLTHYAQLELIRPPRYRGIGRSSGALLGEYEACAAYLFSNLTRLGLKAETLRWVGRYFNYIGVRRRSQDEYFGSLREVIRATKAGRRWFLVVKIRDWSESESWERPSVDAEFQDKPDIVSDAGTHRAIVVLDCYHLLRPLLDLRAKQEGAGAEQDTTTSTGEPEDAS